MPKYHRQITRIGWLLIVAALVALPALTYAMPAEPALQMGRILVVDKGADTMDSACTASPNDCSLRGAIDAANLDPGSTILFLNTPTHTIILGTTALPTITAAGTTVRSDPNQMVRVNANGVDSAFRIAADQVRIEGLQIYGAQIHNIMVTLTGAQQVHIVNNIIGNNAVETTPFCDTAEMIADHGIYITRPSIGYTPGPHNAWVSGNSIECNQDNNATAGGSGITLDGIDGARVGLSNATTASANKIRANKNGVQVINGSTDHQIRHNTITGNQFGVQLINNSSTTQVMSNTITGATATSGPGAGVEIGASSTLNSIQGNIIFGHAQGVDLTSTASQNDINNNSISANGNGVRLFEGPTFNQIRNNMISGNTQDGIYLIGSATQANQISGNRIGTNSAGTAADPNLGDGIEISGGRFNEIGGTPAKRNVISGNSEQGIELTNGASANIIQSNQIGTDASGTATVPNTGTGISVNSGASNNLIGGSAVSHLNLIGGNGTNGILIQGPTTAGNVVTLNDIGVNSTVDPAISLPNGSRGIAILNGAQNNQIGSSASIPPRPTSFTAADPGQSPQDTRDIDLAANLIWFNNGPGIEVNSANNNHIRSNSIRLNSVGILLTGGTNNTIITRTLMYENDTFAIREDSGTNNNTWSELSVYNNNNGGLQIEKLDATAPALPTIMVIGRGNRTFRGTGVASAVVELYANDIFTWTHNQSPAAHGEGRRFLGRTTVDNSGRWSITVPTLALQGINNNCFTAIHTTISGSSEFSRVVCGKTYVPRVTWSR